MTATDDLVKAVIDSNLGGVNDAIKRKANVNFILDEDSGGAMAMALGLKGFDYSFINQEVTLSNGDSILHLAVRRLQRDMNHVSFQIVQRLIGEGANRIYKNDLNETAAQIVPEVFESHQEAVEILLSPPPWCSIM